MTSLQSYFGQTVRTTRELHVGLTKIPEGEKAQVTGVDPVGLLRVQFRPGLTKTVTVLVLPEHIEVA